MVVESGTSTLTDLPVATGVTVLLLGLLTLETIVLLVTYWDYMMDHPGKNEAYILKAVENYSSKSLTFASLTFAGLTFVLAQFFGGEVEVVEGTVFLFTVAFGLFVLSYKLEVFAATRRILFSTQQRLFNYGVLFVVAGLVVFFYGISIRLSIPVGAIAVLVFGLHFTEYAADLRDYSDEIDDSKEQPTLDDFR